MFSIMDHNRWFSGKSLKFSIFGGIIWKFRDFGKLRVIISKEGGQLWFSGKILDFEFFLREILKISRFWKIANYNQEANYDTGRGIYHKTVFINIRLFSRNLRKPSKKAIKLRLNGLIVKEPTVGGQRSRQVIIQGADNVPSCHSISCNTSRCSDNANPGQQAMTKKCLW